MGSVTAKHDVFPRRPWCIRWIWIPAPLLGCLAEPEPPPSTRVEALLPAPVEPQPPSDAACDFVEREARKLGASMPRRLDEDTAVTRVSARGCELTLEYQMLNLAARDVATNGMYAMRARVAEQLCVDPSARATLERGGAFTNVYRDQSRVPIGQFTVRLRDCVTARRSALEESHL
jgi:hypothetical protein